MRCPRCETSQLHEHTRQGVVVDVCEGCRGVWLDRGELEKIVARSQEELEYYEARHETGGPVRSEPPPEQSGDRRREKKRKRRGGFLEELFDVFD